MDFVGRRWNVNLSSLVGPKDLCSADPDTAAEIPDIARIIGMRNVLGHVYAVVDDGVVWEAATARVPAPMENVTGLLEGIE